MGGARDQVNIFREVCLLSMCSRVLGRVIAKRVGRWAEHLKLLDENQAGFRKGRSSADVVQVMMRIHEDVIDCNQRVNEGANGMNQGVNGINEEVNGMNEGVNGILLFTLPHVLRHH